MARWWDHGCTPPGRYGSPALLEMSPSERGPDWERGGCWLACHGRPEAAWGICGPGRNPAGCRDGSLMGALSEGRQASPWLAVSHGAWSGSRRNTYCASSRLLRGTNRLDARVG